MPLGRGFDSSFGYLHAFNGYLHGWAYTSCPRYPGQVSYPPGTPEHGRCTDASVKARRLCYTTDLWADGGPATGLNGTGFEEALLTERVLGIIDGHDPREPLFVYYAMHLLHSPLCAPAAYLERFAFIDNEDRRYVAAMIAMMDDAVGAVVDALQRRGMWESTLLVWSRCARRR